MYAFSGLRFPPRQHHRRDCRDDRRHERRNGNAQPAHRLGHLMNDECDNAPVAIRLRGSESWLPNQRESRRIVEITTPPTLAAIMVRCQSLSTVGTMYSTPPTLIS